MIYNLWENKLIHEPVVSKFYSYCLGKMQEYYLSFLLNLTLDHDLSNCIFQFVPFPASNLVSEYEFQEETTDDCEGKQTKGNSGRDRRAARGEQ